MYNGIISNRHNLLAWWWLIHVRAISHIDGLRKSYTDYETKIYRHKRRFQCSKDKHWHMHTHEDNHMLIHTYSLAKVHLKITNLKIKVYDNAWKIYAQNHTQIKDAKTDTYNTLITYYAFTENWDLVKAESWNENIWPFNLQGSCQSQLKFS